jgi:hypothetical protein
VADKFNNFKLKNGLSATKKKLSGKEKHTLAKLTFFFGGGA